MLVLVRLSLLALFAAWPGWASATCGAVASAAPRLIRASTAPDETRITFLGHASFLIETPAHVRIVTDYNGYNIPVAPPDVATMNHAHSTHYTDHPDPRIPHVLRGWTVGGTPPEYNELVGDVRIRNVATNIRQWGGGGTEQYGNSVFVFETAGLCIAHLSHLHHLLTPDDLAELGQIDIVMAPIDGIWTLSHSDMVIVLEQLHPRLILTMHAFGSQNLHQFLDVVQDRWPADISAASAMTVSRATLPEQPRIIALAGGY